MFDYLIELFTRNFMFNKISFFIILIVLSGLCLSTESFAGSRKKKKKKVTKTEQLQPWEIDTLIVPIPINRQLFTGNVLQQIKIADLKDGSVDTLIELEDTVVSHLVTDALLKESLLVMYHIENLPETPHQTKIRYHRALEGLLKRLNSRSLTLENANYINKSIQNFEALVLAREQNAVMDFVKENANVYSLDNAELLSEYPEAKAYLFEAIGKAKPEMMIKRLPEFAKEAYADPIIAAAAKIVPGTILTYATSTSALSAAVRRNKDPLVQTIVRIATESSKPLRALPFLTEIHNKQKTVKQVDAITAKPDDYFRALVQLKIKGNNISEKAITQELNLRGLEYVREVNRLHDYGAAVRFKSLVGFGSEELYFMMIGSQNEIYTSSYIWMFDRMMEKMKPLSGDEFLKKINMDHFRTFIRMSAGYNKLPAFMKSMTEENQTALMTDFVANLEQGAFDELEDAVDVADAYGSITDAQLLTFLQSEIKKNYERTYNANNSESTKGVIVYGLLGTIFSNANNADDLGSQLSIIPPITYLPRKALLNSKGEIVVQSFFYGDDDGKMSMESFKSNFSGKNWKQTANNGQWITYTSTSKSPIVVYANLPLTEPKDEAAQKALQNHLTKNEIYPHFVIHRGHSYHLEGSLANLTPDVKVVMLGSCGGYHNLAQVLDKSPDAHIISSKQVGSMKINDPMIRAMFDQLQQGKDINWVTLWTDLQKYFNGRSAQEKDLFSDYVPPHKNLGAIFIKAYRKMLLEKELEEA